MQHIYIYKYILAKYQVQSPKNRNNFKWQSNLRKKERHYKKRNGACEIFRSEEEKLEQQKKIKPREKKQIQQQHTRSRPTTTTIKRRSKQASGNNNRRKKQKPCNCVNKNVLNYISFGEMCESRCVREYECVCQRMWVRDKWNFLCFPLRGRKKESRNEVALKQKEKTAPLSPKKMYMYPCVSDSLSGRLCISVCGNERWATTIIVYFVGIFALFIINTRCLLAFSPIINETKYRKWWNIKCFKCFL